MQWRVVKYSSDSTATIILTGVWVDVDLCLFVLYGAFCLVCDITQSCKGGLFVPFTIGQDTDRKHNEGVPAHKTSLLKHLTADDLSHFGSDTSILLCDSFVEHVS